MNAITPYKVEVVQGNFVSSEQVQALQPGMSRQQVREILGTPLVTSVFHADRWEYVFTIKRQGVQAQSRKLTVFFEGERFVRAEGDEMPSEAEFVATLGKPTGKIKVPELQATEAQLAKFPVAKKAADDTAAQAPQPQRSYPPLESR
jgi:outer membrane protein assembly factor BamE